MARRALVALRLPRVNPKVLRLVSLVDDGFEMGPAGPTRDGGLRLRVRRGRETRTFDFAFYEVPAILAATRVLGVAV